jgi:hypothetical protein
MIEFLVPTFGLTGLLPKFIGPTFNLDLNWSFHFLLSNVKNATLLGLEVFEERDRAPRLVEEFLICRRRV